MKDNLFSESVNKGLQFLSQPTPTVQPQPILETIIDEIKEAVAPETQTPPPSPKVEPVEEMEEPASEEEIEDNADSFIWLIDFVQDIILRWLAKRKLKSRAFEIAGDEAMQILREVIKKIRQDGTVVLDQREAQLRDLNDAVDEFIKELPMEEWEKDKLKLPLRQLMKMKNVKVSPWQKMMLAGTMVVVTRVAAFRDI